MELMILHRRLVSGPGRYRYTPPAPRRPRDRTPTGMPTVAGTYAALFMAVILVSIGG